MIKMLTIVGARPQFIKAAAISRAIKNYYSDKIKEVMVHTGQHYDKNMSQVFFDELGLPKEDYNLKIGSSSHGKQTADILVAVEEVLLKEKPDCVLLYGDTNSTLAGALAAIKLHIPMVHVEGGVRFYNKHYPEEVNRIVADHLATLIFVPTKDGMECIQKEGFDPDNTPPYTIDNNKVYYCGDIMYDNSLYFAKVANEKSGIIKKLNLEPGKFVLCTTHRPANTDSKENIKSLFTAFDELSKEHQLDFMIPLHPRTKAAFEKNLDSKFKEKLNANPLLKIVEAVSFLDITCLESNCLMVMTDSGGVQKEAYYFEKPCVIFLEETGWTELIKSGSAKLVGADLQKVKGAFNYFLENKDALKYPKVFGDGKASEFICEKIIEAFRK